MYTADSPEQRVYLYCFLILVLYCHPEHSLQVFRYYCHITTLRDAIPQKNLPPFVQRGEVSTESKLFRGLFKKKIALFWQSSL